MTVAKAFCSCAICDGASQQTGVLIDFYPGSKVRPKVRPYQVVITDLGKTSPSANTVDPSKDVPGVTGAFGAGDESPHSEVNSTP